METKEINQDMVELVVARLENLPSDKEISIGGSGEYSKQEIIEHVKKVDEIGKKMIDIELQFLRLMKEGKFYEYSTPDRA